VIVPVEGSITAPSVGAVSNAKVPPTKPVMVAVPPTHVGVISKEESSAIIDVTETIVVVGQSQLVV
jgi:hypothetical protein